MSKSGHFQYNRDNTGFKFFISVYLSIFLFFLSFYLSIFLSIHLSIEQLSYYNIILQHLIHSPQSLHHSVSDGGILKARVETSVDDLTDNQVSVDQFISSPRKLPHSHADSYFNNEDSSNNAPNNFNGSNNYNSNSSYNNSYNRSSPRSTADHQTPFIDLQPYNGGYNSSTPNNNPALYNLSAASHLPKKSPIIADSDDDAKKKVVESLCYFCFIVVFSQIFILLPLSFCFR